jgi:ABC-type transport system substrate-binding protein
MKKIVLGILCAALMFAQPVFAQKKSLVVGMGSADAGKLDPHIASTTPDKGLLSWMFNGLVRVRPGRISPEYIEPDLAESWTSNPAGTEWTFKIRAGVQCHHGYGEFTADDAVYSLKRASNKATSSYSNDYSAVDKVEALDKSTVKITLKNPVAGFLGYVANVNGGNMICKKAAEEMGENFAKKPIGTGPFMFAEYQPQQFVKLVANKQYFRGAPQINDITYRYIPADSSRDLAFQSGELDMIYGKQDQTWVDRTSKLPGVKVVAMEPGELSELYLNVTVKPLDDIRVRQALTLAIDRWGGSESLGKISLIKGVGGVFRPGAPWGLPAAELEKLPGFDRDIEKSRAEARRLLKEAGVTNLKLKFINRTIDQPFIPAGIYAVDQWRRIGVEAEHLPVETKLWYAAMEGGEFDVVVQNISDFTDDPTAQFNTLLSKHISGIAYSRHTDTKLDDMFNRQSQIVDPAERLKLVNEMERYALTMAYNIPLLWYQRIVVNHKKVKGWYVTPSHFTGQNLVDVWLDE